MAALIPNRWPLPIIAGQQRTPRSEPDPGLEHVQGHESRRSTTAPVVQDVPVALQRFGLAGRTAVDTSSAPPEVPRDPTYPARAVGHGPAHCYRHRCRAGRGGLARLGCGCAGAVRFSATSNRLYVSSGTQTPTTILALCPTVPLVQVDPVNKIGS
jgi:hypothetical protein